MQSVKGFMVSVGDRPFASRSPAGTLHRRHRKIAKTGPRVEMMSSSDAHPLVSWNMEEPRLDMFVPNPFVQTRKLHPRSLP